VVKKLLMPLDRQYAAQLLGNSLPVTELRVELCIPTDFLA
jgi:hypothetical protein